MDDGTAVDRRLLAQSPTASFLRQREKLIESYPEEDSECTFIKFVDNIKLKHIVNMLQGRAAIQRGLDRPDECENRDLIKAAAGQGEAAAAAEAPATPYVGLRRPLGYKLAKATKERIWRGEFIDLFSLLHTELAPEHGPRPGDTLDQWVSAFLVYASVLCEKHPARCGAMFKYLDTIRKLHATYGGTSWMNYDEDFRRRAAKNPSLPWGDVDLDLWMKWMAPLKSLVPRHSRAEVETQPSPAPPAPPAQSPKQEEKSQTP
ncbi:uncharacterized protein LOC113947489 [Corapipo altera]|uniref:uncharacterized protein LOC113947489 n=1 Tax=Corapipo altera TaxID=415028 RepID=UPI000FD6794D|nr:uncharacterized protein LOC113947489 [Corapipo altera]